MSLDKSTGYQSLQSLTFEPQHWTAGVLVKLKELQFKVKLFKLVSTNGDIEWLITNDLSVDMNTFVIEVKMRTAGRENSFIENLNN